VRVHRREIPRSARNDKINYFSHSLFTLWVLVLARTNPHRLKSLGGNYRIFVGHGFKPCRNACRINAASAAGLAQIEFSHRLRSLPESCRRARRNRLAGGTRFHDRKIGSPPRKSKTLSLEKTAKMGYPSGEGRLLEDRLSEEGKASARPFGRAPRGLQPLRLGLAKIQKNKDNGI
jgi:hypothetical protein